MFLRAVFVGLLLCVIATARINTTTIAAATTIAVNAGTMAKWVRHPKRQAKATGKQIKDAVKGKN